MSDEYKAKERYVVPEDEDGDLFGADSEESVFYGSLTSLYCTMAQTGKYRFGDEGREASYED